MHKQCSIPDCANPSCAHGWCNKHYARWRAHGDPRANLRPDVIYGLPVEQRFWRYVDQSSGPDACWPWMAARRPFGYGLFTDRSLPSRGAQVIAYGLTYGIWPEKGQIIRHHCDNPPCCNPKHLAIGVQKDNIADCVKRGRKPMGDALIVSVVSNQEARAIRERYAVGDVTQRVLAAEYGIGQTTVSHIVRRDTYRHI